MGMDTKMKKVTYSKFVAETQSAIDSGLLIILKSVKVAIPEHIAIELFKVTHIQAVICKSIVGAKLTPFSNGIGLDHRIIGKTTSNELVSYIVDDTIVGVGDIPLLHKYIKMYCPIDMSVGVENIILRSCRAIIIDGEIIIM